MLSSCSVFGGFSNSGDEVEYTIQAGDSLYKIARNYDISALELQKRNRIEDARKLRVGQIIKIPVRNSSDHKPYGGPFISAETARKQRENVTFPPIESLGIVMAPPLEKIRIGSSFGVRGNRFHEGIDLLAAEGAPVYAAHDGTVIFSGQKLSGYGKMVALKQGQILTIYAHNSENLVSPGDTVKQGTKIAEVGQTGRATGPHLHFEVRLKGSNGRYYAIEPMDFLRAGKH